MAQLALAGGGAVIGSFFGPLGTSIGWALGGLAGAMLFPPKGKDSGPRLGDLTVQASTYGTGIPVVFGTIRLAGNLIWSSGILATTSSRRVGGKGGGQKQATQEYYASFGISFCRGEADSIRRLWFDEKLVYDATGGSVQLTLPGLTWRWYPGSETQLPDPMYEAAVGTDEAVPYRGEVTAWFEQLPLKDLGNRIPNVTAEIVMAGATVGTIAYAEGPANGGGPPDHDLHLSIDWNRRRAYSYQGSASIVETNIDTMESRALAASVDNGYTRLFTQVGDYVLLSCGSDNSEPIIKYDKNSGVELARFGSYNSSLSNTTTNTTVPWNNSVLGFSVYSELDVRRFLVWSPFIFDVGSYCIDLDTMTYVWGDATNATLGTVANGGRFCEGDQRLNETDIYTAGVGIPNFEISRFTVTTLAAGVTAGPSIGATVGVTCTLIIAATASSLSMGTGTVTVTNILHDPMDDTLIVTAGASSVRLIKFATDGTVLWNVPAPAVEESGRYEHRIVNGTYGVLANGVGYLINTATGETISTSTIPGFLAQGTQVYDSERQAVYTFGAGFRRVLIGRSTPDSPLLSDVVTAICVEAGLDASDLDVTELTDEVRGYVLARPMSARDALTPLGVAFGFDAVESDDVLRFVKRGGSVVATLDYDDLAREGEGGVVAEQRAQDVELPRAVTVRHIDIDRGYEPGAQRWQRPMAPTPTMASKQTSTIDLPLVLTADEAKAIARRQVTAAWRERVRFTFTGTTQHLRHEPTDPVTLTLRDGSTVRTRIISAQLGADWTLKLEAVAEDAIDYALTADADGGTGRPDDVLPTSYAVRGFAPSLPLLADADDAGGGSLRAYLLAGTYGTDTWLGAEAWRSTGGAYAFIDVLPGITAWGAVTEAVAVPASYWVWDDDTTITVAVQTGAARLESCTDLEALNGANMGCLVSSAGAVEVIHHATATDNGDGTITLSRLIRGVRGTEDAGAFAAGSIYILLDGTDLQITSALATLGSAESFRFVGLYDRVEFAETVSRAAAGRAERPYAPVEIAATRDGSNNITLTWTRRTRIGGEWMDYVETVPVSEVSEAYEVDIRNSGDTTTLRTITGITSPTTTYSAANQTTDGLTPGDPVVVRVYQISAAVGRGTAGAATI